MVKARTKDRAAAYHEAGHAVARAYVKAPITAVDIGRDGSGRSHGTGDRWGSWNRQPNGQYDAWDSIIVNLAGIYAESRIRKRSAAFVMLTHGAADASAVDVPCEWLFSHGYTDSMNTAYQRGESETRQFVREQWPAIVRVAEALLVKRRLEAPEVAALIGAVSVSPAA